MKRKIVFPVIALSSIFLSGCLFGSKSSRLVPTESITTTEETTTEITSAETTTETTVETYETTAETTVSEETTENTTTSEESSATKGTTKATNKTPTTTKSPSKKPKTTKTPTNKTTATKAPTKKPTTKPVVKPKTTKTPTKKPTPVPSKGYAMVKFKFSVTMRDKDENGNYIKHSFTKNIKCVTTNYHSTKIGDYHLCDEDALLKAVKSEAGPNYRNYSASKSKVVDFLN